jgi:hypothetical protein
MKSSNAISAPAPSPCVLPNTANTGTAVADRLGVAGGAFEIIPEIAPLLSIFQSDWEYEGLAGAAKRCEVPFFFSFKTGFAYDVPEP